jgi:hypothetical protein
MKRLVLALPLLLAGCGTLPEPFYGNPGPEAARLALPPAPVLMVPTPSAALLNSKEAALYAGDLATALANYDVPSVAGPGSKIGWQLGISAQQAGGSVIPAYVIIGPNGKVYGKQQGTPVPAQGWASGDSTTLHAAAAADAPALSKAMAAINAQIQQSNPASLENRVPRVFIGAVTGAPGDGDTALPMNLARDLPGPNIQVVTNPAQADFTITGTVKTKPDANSQILVELDWVVRDANHRIAGQVTQMHDLAPSDVQPYWGDVAAAAASEAAGGLQTVVENAVLKKTKAPAPQRQ